MKLKDICDTIWLSHLNAVDAVRRCHTALITSLEREASERTDATAAGLATFVKTPFFVCTIAMMSDVLPHLNRLSKIFQKTTVDYSLVDPLVASTQVVLQNLLDKPGDNMKDLPNQFTKLAEYGVKYSDKDLENFNNQVYKSFINNVIENLHDRFPDNTILDAFTVFDPELINQEDPSLHEFVQFTGNKLQVSIIFNQPNFLLLFFIFNT